MRTLRINAKCSDMCSAVLTLGDDQHERHDYVPSGLGVGGGDYVRFTVDLDTGQILGWVSPSVSALREFIGDAEFDGEEEE